MDYAWNWSLSSSSSIPRFSSLSFSSPFSLSLSAPNAIGHFFKTFPRHFADIRARICTGLNFFFFFNTNRLSLKCRGIRTSSHTSVNRHVVRLSLRLTMVLQLTRIKSFRPAMDASCSWNWFLLPPLSHCVFSSWKTICIYICIYNGIYHYVS